MFYWEVDRWISRLMVSMLLDSLVTDNSESAIQHRQVVDLLCKSKYLAFWDSDIYHVYNSLRSSDQTFDCTIKRSKTLSIVAFSGTHSNSSDYTIQK